MSGKAEGSHYELVADTYTIGRPGAYFHDAEALDTSVWVFGSTWTQAWECFDGFCFGPAYVHVINSDVAVEIEDPTGVLVFATTVTTTADGGEYWFWPGFTFPGFHLDIPYADFATIAGTYTARLSSVADLPDLFPSDPLSAGAGNPYEATPWEGFFDVPEDQIPADDEGPVVSAVVANPNPLAVNTDTTLTANVDDTLTGGSKILIAEYSIDGGSRVDMDAQDGDFDEVNEDATALVLGFAEAGIRTFCVDGTDIVSNIGSEECILLAVFDPDGGFVTGGGWINSPEEAYVPNPSLTGKANFGFVSKYKKGTTEPTGQTEFQFHVADLNFHSDSYQWLVVTGSNYAMFKGEGTINGDNDSQGNPYKFKIWAGDAAPDTFRIRIWTEDEVTAAETDVYDNGSDQPIGGGSIVIHDK
jgi:hypothetical protein